MTLRFFLPLIFIRCMTTSMGLETTASLSLIPYFCPFRKYQITLDFDNLRKLDQLVFRRAACRWSQIIRSDKSNVNLKNSSLRTDCGAYPSHIDDLYICASSRRNDGLGGVLAFAMATFYRTDFPYTPLAGFIQIDEEDIGLMKQDKTFFATILHEMGHMLGINYYTWKKLNLVGDESASPPCPYRLDSNATREWQRITGCSNAAPVDGAYEYACSHWNEDCMQQELMTGFIEPGDSLKISKITIGSLQDMGYKVNYRKAGKYTSKDVNPACLCKNTGVASENTTVTAPSSAPQPQKQLSDKGRAEAEAHGRALILAYGINQTLTQQQEQQQQQQQDETPDVLPYLPGFTAFVLYKENDIIYSVPVTL